MISHLKSCWFLVLAGIIVSAMIYFGIINLIAAAEKKDTRQGSGEILTIETTAQPPPSPTLENSAFVTSTTLLSPTPTIKPSATQSDNPPTAPPITPLPTAPPLAFVFPTPNAPPPISSWRPPLYQAPWAPTPFDHFYFTRPIGADEVNWPLDIYRYGAVTFEDVTHTGVDIVAPIGTPVLATGPGQVTWAGNWIYAGQGKENPYSLAVFIRHEIGFEGQTLYTLYAHLSRVDVVKDQFVESGDQLGLVGNTGLSTGPHLHFEVRAQADNFFKTFNPELWMAPPQGWGILVAQVLRTSNQLLYGHPMTVTSLETGQTWRVKSYESEVGITRDSNYQENLVLGDLPEGNYQLKTPYLGRNITTEIAIYPGQVTAITFQGRNGYLSPTSEVAFTPPD